VDCCNLFLCCTLNIENQHMKKYISALFLSFIVLMAAAQKTVNDPNAELRSVGSFHALHLSDAFDVILTQGNEERVAVSANDKKIVAYITTEVVNGVLRIGFKDDKNSWMKNRKLKAYIAVKSLDEIKAGGASDIHVEGTLSVPQLKLSFSGASDLSGKLMVNGLLGVDLSGASDLNIDGSAGELNIDASGASNVKAYGFTVRSCTVKASGACNVRINVEKELSAHLSGASNVYYKGAAMIKDIKTSGASNISKQKEG
jgi:Putative auto-transporter adhesin, head GIN domain